LARDKAGDLLAVALPRGDKTFIALAQGARRKPKPSWRRRCLQSRRAARRWRAGGFIKRRKICACQGEGSRAEAYRQQTGKELARLADTLNETDPLRQTLRRNPAARSELALVAGLGC